MLVQSLGMLNQWDRKLVWALIEKMLDECKGV